MIPDKFDEYALIILAATIVATWTGVFIFQYVKALSLQADEGPNWPIHELFSYLKPDLLNPEHNRWEDAADEIRDALSLGRIRIWGHLCKTQLGDWVGQHASLRPIDKAYWYKAYFTYSFFDETSGKSAHCYADRTTGVPAYTDLQVNRSEVQELWPLYKQAMAEKRK